MNHRVFLNEDGIIESVYEGPISLGEATQIFENGYKLALAQEEEGIKTRSLVNIEKLGKFDPMIPTLAIKSFKGRVPGKMAVYGGNPNLGKLVNMVSKISGVGDDMRMFKTREQAISWLKE